MAAGWPGSKKRKAGGVDSSNKNKVLALPKPVGPVGHLGLGGGAGLGGPEQQVQPEVSAKVQQAALNSVALCSATGALPVGPKQVGAQALGLQLQTAGAASRLAAWRSPASALVGLSGPPVKQELPKETFGYSINVAKSQLCQYCQKRGLSSDIPVSRNGNGPVTARMQIQLPPNRGGVVRQEYTCNGKNAEAVNMVALLMCIELCKRGEMAPFRTKAQQLAEGVRPCSLELSDESMASLRDFEGQLDTYLTGLGTSAQPRSPVGLQLDFDAAAWATTPEAQEITWSPPSWGSSPWGGSEHAAVGGEEEEFNANVQLLAQLQERQASKGFAAMQSQRALLPIASMAQEIIAAIETHAVTLISGSTGCGKTTQVPQLLLEHAIRQNQGTSLNMACTQPRRLAAMAAAERVAEERGEPLGHSVGFIVRFHQVVPRSYASICFMTTGMLLRRLSGRGLRGISHVIIDEVHERDLDTDFLLTVVRNLLLQCPGMRVILMSATIELAKWSRYFGQDFGAGIEIPGRLFPVTTHYLDEVERLTGHVLDQHQQKLESDVPLDLVEKLLMRIVDVSASGDGGAILVFLPGWDSISKLQTRLKKQPGLNSRIQLHTLHSHKGEKQGERQREMADEHPERLLEVKLQDVGVALEPDAESLNLVLTFDHEGPHATAPAPTTVSCAPTDLQEKSFVGTASQLCPKLGPIDRQLLALELQDLATLRTWARAFVGPLAGQQRACLLGNQAVPQATDWNELESSLPAPDPSLGSFRGRLCGGLGAALKQRGQLESFAGDMARHLDALGVGGSSLRSVQFLESKAAWWVDAADGLVQMLNHKGVKRGQVIAIDAHTSKPEEEAAFSAHYSLSLPSSGDLGIRYKRLEVDAEAFSWQSLYEWANGESRGRQIISMTGSCSRGDGGVFTSFYYVDPCDLDDIEVLHRQSPDGRAAAKELSEALAAASVRAGQILWVDAHKDEGIALAAHFSRSLPSRGELKLKCETCHRGNFRELHEWAATRLAALNIAREDFISATCTVDTNGKPTCFLFYTVPPHRKRRSTNPRPFPAPPWPSPLLALRDEHAPTTDEHEPATSSNPWPSGPLQVAAQMVDDFEVLQNTLIFLGGDVHTMPATDLEACKDRCRQQRWGAFIVTNGQAYFRQESAEQCEVHLVTDPRSTTYIRRLPGSAGASKLHLVGAGAPEIDGAVRHQACGGCATQ